MDMSPLLGGWSDYSITGALFCDVNKVLYGLLVL